MHTPKRPSSSPLIPFWRDVRVLGVLAQMLFVIGLVISLGWLGNNMAQGLRKLGAAQFQCDDGSANARCAFNFMSLPAAFDIGEPPIDYAPADSYWRAVAVGLLNTLKVSVIGVVLATLLGVVAGIAVLSNNWLLSRLALVYIDLIRNTPLLVQLFFLYFILVLQIFPPVKESLQPGLGIYLNQRGVSLPWPVFTAAFVPWLAFIFLGLLLFLWLASALGRREQETGQRTNRWFWSTVAALVVIGAGWSVTVEFSAGQGVLASRASRIAQARSTLEGLEAIVAKRLPSGMDPATAAVKLTPVELAKAALRVCVVKDTPGEPNLIAQLKSRSLPYAMQRFDRSDQAIQAYNTGECEVFAGERAMLAAERAVLDKPASHVLAPVAEYPVVISAPRLEGLNLVGGIKLTPEYAAMLFGLVVYTAAFIAEIVRAGILAVPRGQSEAARALGLTETQRLRLVVLPQALRVIIPPLTSQYLNLVKNSSLAVAVGYPDLVAVTNTIINQSGRSVQVVALVMGTYLVISLAISAVLNWYNQRVALVER